MEQSVELIYRNRFSERERRDKGRVWEILTKEFFQRYILPTDTVLDAGAGFCEFINNVRARDRIAADISKDTIKYAGSGVKVVPDSCSNLRHIKDSSVDVVFMSNILEHLSGRQEVEKAFLEARRVLRPGGRLLILQPNIRYAYKEYWDFFDHVTPISDRGMVEGLRQAGFEILLMKPKFLPFSSKSTPLKWDILVRAYLEIGLLQQLFGKQLFCVSRKPAS